MPKPAPVAALVADAFKFDEIDELIPEVALTVEVFNVSQREPMGALAAERLEYSGFATHVAVHSPEQETSTYLIDYGLAQDGSTQEILQSFGLSGQDLVSEPDPTSPFAFRLVVGDDYDPCFNPARDQLN